MVVLVATLLFVAFLVISLLAYRQSRSSSNRYEKLKKAHNVISTILFFTYRVSNTHKHHAQRRIHNCKNCMQYSRMPVFDMHTFIF